LARECVRARRLNPARPDSAVLDWRFELTAPEAVVRSRLHLRRLLGEGLAGPRLVRRLLSVRFSGGFAGPGQSTTGHMTSLYVVLVSLRFQA
jgi:hypothetical protein